MKKIISLLSVILILAAIAVPAVSADDGYISHIVDEAGKLDSSDAAELENTYAGMYDEYGFDVVAMTIDGLPDDRSLMEYADDYYDYNGYSDDGCILVVNVPLRDCWISTKGYGITALTDYGIDYIGDQLKPDLKDNDYHAAFKRFYELVEKFYKEAKNGKPFDTNHKVTDMGTVLKRAGVSFAIGLVIAILAVLVLWRKYKPVMLKAEANDYLVEGSLVLRQSYDHFLYTHVDRTRKSDDDNGGGSSTHTSSSGSSHGGGGFSF